MKSIFKFCPLCGHRLRRKHIDGCKRSHCQKCGWIHYKNPLPVAVCAAKNKEGKVLVTKRNIKPGINKWALPGGFAESHETPESACLRELKEETGVKGKIKRLLGVYLHRTKHYGSLFVIGYEASIMKDSISISSELKDAKFFSKADMPHIPFMSHRKMLNELFKNES